MHGNVGRMATVNQKHLVVCKQQAARRGRIEAASALLRQKRGQERERERERKPEREQGREQGREKEHGNVVGLMANRGDRELNESYGAVQLEEQQRQRQQQASKNESDYSNQAIYSNGNSHSGSRNVIGSAEDSGNKNIMILILTTTLMSMERMKSSTTRNKLFLLVTLPTLIPLLLPSP